MQMYASANVNSKKNIHREEKKNDEVLFKNSVQMNFIEAYHNTSLICVASKTAESVIQTNIEIIHFCVYIYLKSLCCSISFPTDCEKS